MLKRGLGHSPKRGEGGSPTLSPGMDAGRVCPKALHDAEPTKHTQPFPRGKGFGDRDNKSELYFKNILFLQAERPPERRSCCFMLLVGLRLILAVVMQHSCSLMRFLFNVHLRVGFIYIIVYMEL